MEEDTKGVAKDLVQIWNLDLVIYLSLRDQEIKLKSSSLNLFINCHHKK